MKGFSEGLGIELITGELSDEELETARRLREEMLADPVGPRPVGGSR
jgi:lipoate-protein ligase A